MTEDDNLVLSIERFVNIHSQLLDLEYEEEKKEFKYNTLKPDIAYLERKGVLINNLVIENITSEFGCCIVEFRRSPMKSTPISITCGDVTSVWMHDTDRHCSLASGTVMQVGKTVKISFDNSNSFQWDQDKKYFILKTLSEITYKRMKSAIQNIMYHKNGRCATVVKHLFRFTPLVKSPLHKDFLNENGELNFFNRQLHDSQKDAVKFCLEQEHFAVVHGPPGTGKTTTLVEIILQYVSVGKKVLVCAPSNIAVDTILEKLKVIKSKIIRIGKTARMLESSKNFSVGAVLSSRDDAPIVKVVKAELERRQRELKEADHSSLHFLRNEIQILKRELYFRQYRALQELLRNASVVLTTLVSAGDDGDLKNVPDDHFDVVIIDECSQAIEASCWIVIPRAPKVILAGDHFQLPPTVKSKSAYETGLGISLMERIIGTMGESCYKLLTHQFRMNTCIMNWVSSLYYGNKLVADDSVANRLLKDLSGVKKTDETEMPLLLVDTAFCNLREKELRGSKCNEGEAEVVAVIIKRLIEAGLDEKCISVITPYTLQVSCINSKIANYPNVEVRTVDGFQGRQKEAVIISLVRSNKKKELGFIGDKRRLNVAVSRAQYLLAVVGDSYTVREDLDISKLWKHIQDNGIVYSAHQFTKEIDDMDFPVFMPKDTEDPKSKKLDHKTKKGNTAGTSKKKQEASADGVDKQMNTRSVRNSSKHQSNPDTQNFEKTCTELHCPSQGKGSNRKMRTEKYGKFTEAFETYDCPTLDYQENLSKCNETEIADTAAKQKGKVSKEKKSSGDTSKVSASTQRSNKVDEDLKAIEESLMKNNTCSMKGCNVSIKLYPQLCQHCRDTFCLTHMLPEIHGCGEAAKKAARHTFRHTFLQNVQPQPPAREKDKKLASIKLKKKVAEMAAERKPQKKK